MFSVADVTAAELDAFWSELAALYRPAETDPAGVVICPQINPVPHPTKAEFAAHIADNRTQVRVIREDGAFVMVLLMLDGNRVRAAWGPVDPDAYHRATVEPGGAAEYVEPRPYLIDTGAAGWVVRGWFAAYCAPVDMFDTTATDHDGLGGALLETWDDVQWRLVIERPTPADPWEWRYELVDP